MIWSAEPLFSCQHTQLGCAGVGFVLRSFEGDKSDVTGFVGFFEEERALGRVVEEVSEGEGASGCPRFPIGADLDAPLLDHAIGHVFILTWQVSDAGERECFSEVDGECVWVVSFG